MTPYPHMYQHGCERKVNRSMNKPDGVPPYISLSEWDWPDFGYATV